MITTTNKVKKILPFLFIAFLIIVIGVLFFINKKLFLFTLLACAPISELRGAIPLGYLSYNYPLLFCYIGAIILNWSVAPLLIFFLDNLHPLLLHIPFYNKTVGSFLTKAHIKLKNKVDRYGLWGIMLFIAVPIPVTGVYTGIAGAWVLGLDKKRALISAFGGVLISATIVTFICYLIKNKELSSALSTFISFFIKAPTGV